MAVGTPGRLLALLGAKAIPTRQVSTLIMDEADQLMGTSFHADVMSILAELPASKQVEPLLNLRNAVAADCVSRQASATGAVQRPVSKRPGLNISLVDL